MEMWLSQVSDVSEGQEPRGRLAPAGSPHLKDAAERERDAQALLLRGQDSLLICWVQIALQPSQPAAAAFISGLP